MNIVRDLKFVRKVIKEEGIGKILMEIGLCWIECLIEAPKMFLRVIGVLSSNKSTWEDFKELVTALTFGPFIAPFMSRAIEKFAETFAEEIRKHGGRVEWTDEDRNRFG